jgi:hypothetical protein
MDYFDDLSDSEHAFFEYLFDKSNYDNNFIISFFPVDKVRNCYIKPMSEFSDVIGSIEMSLPSDALENCKNIIVLSKSTSLPYSFIHKIKGKPQNNGIMPIVFILAPRGSDKLTIIVNYEIELYLAIDAFYYLYNYMKRIELDSVVYCQINELHDQFSYSIIYESNSEGIDPIAKFAVMIEANSNVSIRKRKGDYGFILRDEDRENILLEDYREMYSF